MKTILNIALILALTLPFAACDKMLMVEPESDITDTNYYKDEVQLNSAIIGCYNGLQKTLENEWMLTELRSDNSWQNVTGSTSQDNYALDELDMFFLQSGHEKVYQYWYATYQNIASINLALANMDVVETASLRTQLEGEARFLRAYHYFNLVRLFGPTFILTETKSPQDAKKLDRRPVEEVYARIIEDLQFAETLPTDYRATKEEGRATRWAAKALLAKVHMTLGAFDLALPLLTQIKSSGHDILPKYEDVFSTTNEMNIEILFSVRYKAGGYGLGCPFGNLFAPLQSGTNIIIGDGKGQNYPTTDLINSYEVGDLRKDISIGLWGSKNQYYVKKYISPVTTANDGESDWPILRYADVLLMLAECENEINGPATAIPYINQIRNRAGLGVFSSASQMETRLQIENERRHELAFENHRFFDLVRTGRFIEVLEKEIFVTDFTEHYSTYRNDRVPKKENIVKSWQLLLPIPLKEIDTNNEFIITQNFGY